MSGFVYVGLLLIKCHCLYFTGTACPVVTCPTAAPITTAPGVTPEMTTTMLTTTTAPPVIDVRLPTDLEPILYTVELQPNMYEGEPADFTFNGSVSIEIRCKQQTNKIHLQIKKLNITSKTDFISYTIGLSCAKHC